MTDTIVLKYKKVLVVDDEPDVLEVMEEILDMCEVVKASTFDEARELLKKNDFDLVILDIMGVDGYKLLNIAKSKDMTAVMLTANALSSEHLIRAIKNGAASYIPKEEMVNITDFLVDILESQDKGKSTWNFWQKRLYSPYFGKEL